MQDKELEKYITKAYARLLDYSLFHCKQQGFNGLEYDLLNNVLTGILDRASRQEEYMQKLLDMLHTQREKWNELDYYVLKTIKFNAQSDTAPFKRKYDLYKPTGTFPDVDLQRLDIIDDKEENDEKESDMQDKEARFKAACDVYGLSDKAKSIFEWKFQQRNSLSDYPLEEGESIVNIYRIYKGVMEIIMDRLNGRVLF